MKSILSLFFSYCRSNAYLIIGICFGLCISSFLAPVDVPNCLELTDEPSVSAPLDDLYDPQINLEGKPLRAKKTPKVFMRPRYYSTELGIRDKLFVGVITSREYLYSRGVVRNKTMAHLVDKIRYFISIPEGTRPNVTLPGIVGFTDTRSILKPFHVLKYITDNYLEDYDYYFLVNDLTYVDARKLVNLVNKISISRDVHLGVASEVDDFCSLDLGILLSNSVIRKIKTNLDWCVKNTYSESDDINFGRCVVHSTSLPCSNTIQGQSMKSTILGSMFNFEKDFHDSATNHSGSISTYPIFDSTTAYKLNAYVARISLEAVEELISILRQQIPMTRILSSAKDESVTWPIGNQPGNKPANRFDVIRWMYFNETYRWSESNGKNVQELKDAQKIDIEYVMRAAISKIESNNNGRLQYKQLLNGYEKYDASRGMDYILDLVFQKVENGEEVVKRIEICKPLGKVEILSVPYVTENARLHFILIVEESKKAETMKFLEYYSQTCMERKDKTFLMVVLLYNPNSPSKSKEDVFYDIKQYALSLTERYKKDQSKVAWLSIRLLTTDNSIDADPELRIAIADLAVRKFSPESLILFVDTGMDLNIDYLNRVRMNTISQWQVFSPIPFLEYHPDIAYATSKLKDNELDVNRNFGRYDEYNFVHISFYAKDYLTVRKLSETTVPVARTDRDIPGVLKSARRNNVGSIFEMFARYSDLHSFRALEPALKIKHREINCGAVRSDSTYLNCIETRHLNLGNRGQLAKLILNYKQDH